MAIQDAIFRRSELLLGNETMDRIAQTRVIIVGVKDGKRFEFPAATGRTTLAEAIGDMPAPEAGDVCAAPYSSRYMSRNRKRRWDDVSYTIPAMAKQCPLHPSSPDMLHMGPDDWRFGDGKTRRFSWREAAAVQTFPKNLEFAGDLTKKYLQIGNAVPVKLAQVVGAAVMAQVF